MERLASTMMPGTVLPTLTLPISRAGDTTVKLSGSLLPRSVAHPNIAVQVLCSPRWVDGSLSATTTQQVIRLFPSS